MNKFKYQGTIISVRPIVTKKGCPMAEVVLKTGAGAVTIACHGNIAGRLAAVAPGCKVILSGTFLLSAWEMEIDEETVIYERPEKTTPVTNGGSHA